MENYMNASCLSNELRRLGNNHIKYNHYGKRKRLLDNLRKNSLYLTDGSSWNDKRDSDNFSKNSKGFKRYGICFSYSLQENVAMWMIYSEKKAKKGLMLSLPRKMLNRIIENNKKEVEIGNFNGDAFVSKGTVKIKNIYLTDIYYTSYSKNIKCNRGNEHIYIDQKTLEKTIHLSKAYPWHYETECRLIVEIDKDLCDGCEAARIKLTDQDVCDILHNYLIEAPLNDETDFKLSKLSGDLRE